MIGEDFWILKLIDYFLDLYIISTPAKYKTGMITGRLKKAWGRVRNDFLKR